MASLRQKSKTGSRLFTRADESGRDTTKKSSFAGLASGPSALLSRSMRARPGAEAGAAAATDLGVLLGSRARAIAVFEQDDFSKEAFIAEYFRGLSEKAVGNAAQDLGALLSQCTEEVEGVVYEHHQRFLEACKGVEDIEDQVALLRNYTNGLTALVASLKGQKALGRQVQAAGRSALAPVEGEGLAEGGANSRVRSIESQLEVLLRELDVAVAVRDLPTARALLAAGQDCLAILDRDAGVLSLEVDEFPSWRHHLENAIAMRKRALAAALERQLADAHASGPEIRFATRGLGQLLGDCHAVAAMLHCYSRKIAVHQALLMRQLSAGGADPDNMEYAGGLMQRTLLEIARAADDLVTIFGAKQRDVASLFSVWVVREARGCAAALKRNALAAAAAAAVGSLEATTQIISLALIFCRELEASHMVSVTAAVSAELWPSLDGALKRHVRRFNDEIRMVTAAEVDDLVLQAVGDVIKRIAPDGPPQVTLVSTATLASELRSLSELMAPMEVPKLAAVMRKIVRDVFEGYVQVVSSNLRRHIDASPSGARKLQPLVAPVMEEIASLLEVGIPGALAPFEARAGPAHDPRELDAALQALYSECSAACSAAGARRGGGSAPRGEGGG
ncbi:MAG: hypothetical protein J3K34DRAFT_153633 [Monoraphidium minutum]|nr:MAG: hypothetical protein J3K34DRAFT_153633 [Monoraphidium minutum]